MTVRRAVFLVHLYGGLAAGAFLVVAALSGGLLAFAPDYDHWLHPGLWRVTPRRARLAEADVASIAARTGATAGPVPRIARVDLGGDAQAQVFTLESGERIWVDPWTGRVLGTRLRPEAWERWVETLFQLHVRLLAGNAGQMAVDAASAAGVLLTLAGLVLWWRAKRVTVRRDASFRLAVWDLHNAVGALAFAPGMALALTGLLMAWEAPLEWLTHSPAQRIERPPRSAAPADGAPSTDASLDAIVRAADLALPGATTFRIVWPSGPRSSYRVMRRGPGRSGVSSVFVDRYDARVLRVDDARRETRASRAHALAEDLHTGDVLGAPTRALAAVASLAVAFLAATGAILWAQRAVRPRRRPLVQSRPGS